MPWKPCGAGFQTCAATALVRRVYRAGCVSSSTSTTPSTWDQCVRISQRFGPSTSAVRNSGPQDCIAYSSLCMTTILRRAQERCCTMEGGILEYGSTHHVENTRHSRRARPVARHYEATPLCRKACTNDAGIVVLIIACGLLSGKRLITKEVRRPRRSRRVAGVIRLRHVAWDGYS